MRFEYKTVVLASKTKIYMVLEYVDGGELSDKIPENILVDSKGNIKISDFGLSALPEQLRNDGLLHTTCGSPSYVSPEVLANRGYNGATSDIWSCGVILYVILAGYLPFDDRNIAVLYQKIFKGDCKMPRWLSPGAKNLIRRILDPNPKTRIDVDGIKADDWFRKNYTPVVSNEEEEDARFDDAIAVKVPNEGRDNGNRLSTLINAFQLIGMSSSLDLSGLFETQEFNGRKWGKFNSEKVASLAYARIQGKSALVTHFQNSSLMNEDKRCRPILFNSQEPETGDQVKSWKMISWTRMTLAASLWLQFIRMNMLNPRPGKSWLMTMVTLIT